MRRSITKPDYNFVLVSKDPWVFTKSIIPECSIYPPDKNSAAILDPAIKLKINTVGEIWHGRSSINNFYTQAEVDVNAVIDFTIGEIQDNGLCKNIDLCFIEYELIKAEMILCLRLDTAVQGLAILNTNERENCLMIKLLCGSSNYSKIGTILIDEAKNIAKLFKYDSIKLHSVPASIMFYFKKGFHCNTPDKLCNMKLNLPVDVNVPVVPFVNKTANSKKNRNKTRKAKVKVKTNNRKSNY
jgi:hypothetical protein